MLKIEIHESTPDNMLRAIRAACNELLGDTTPELIVPKAAEQATRAKWAYQQAAADAEAHKAAAALSAHNRVVGEQPSEQTVLAVAFDKAVETVGAPAVAAALVDEPAEELDSTGAELHASTKAKNQDGTWKKRRGAGKETDAVQDMGKDPLELSKEQNPQVARDLPPLPPTPPAPATPLVTMNDIYALITNGKAVLNDVIAAAQAMGFADVGAFSRDATPEQRAQLLAQLTKEVA